MHDDIGEVAGEIYSYLEKEKVASLTELVNYIDRPKSHIYMGIGWLLRENKLLMEQKSRGKAYDITLKEKPFLRAEVIRAKLDIIASEIDSVAESKGKNAKKAFKGVKEKLKDVSMDVKSKDIKGEVKTVIKNTEKLAEATGKEAKGLVGDIKTRIKRIKEHTGNKD